jgi:prepilin-type N-terminal cleavage/methylation domain-containing protein
MTNRARMASSRSGMTLIELVVVLALLAGLAAMTLTGVADLGHRGRYDETTARMKLIREAVVGNGVEPGRFIRDMGRLPVVQSGMEGEELSELWKNDVASLDYDDIESDPIPWPDSPLPSGVPSTVTLRCGWNGPYLMVDDPDTAKSYDGFGNPWQVATNALGEVTLVESLGSDGVAGGAAWDEQDRTNNLAALLPRTELTVLVKARSSTNSHTAAWWTVKIESGAQPYQVDALRVGLFAPSVSDYDRTVDQSIVTNAPDHTFTNLMPTTVRVFAYGTGTTNQVSGDVPEWIDLRPGHNIVTLYLREP